MTDKNFSKISDLLKNYGSERDKFISVEFQKYGYDLAVELDDLKHKSLYIKLAKDTPRGFIEAAKNFVKDAHNAKSKARLFMWKLKQLKETAKKKKALQP